MEIFCIVDSSALKSEINRLRKDYFFRFNEQATSVLSAQIGFRVGRLCTDGDNLFVTQASDTEKVLKFDSSFNLTGEYSLKDLLPILIFFIIPYQDNHLVVDGKSGKIYVLDEKFKLVSDLSGQVPELKGKLIVCAQPDGKGGIYFAEKSSGNVFYMDTDSQITCFKTDARLPYFMAYCNDTLYIADMFLLLIAREFNNVYYLKDGKSERTQITGDSLVYCKDIDSIFVSNYILTNSITKYSSGLNKIFSKLLFPVEKYIQPCSVQLFKNHIICLDYATLKPVVYDIY